MSNPLFKTDSAWEKFINSLVNIDKSGTATFENVDNYVRDMLRGAENGDSESQFNLGKVFSSLRKKKNAEKYFLMAAEQGYTKAMHCLGCMLVRTRRDNEAEGYFRMAAGTRYGGRAIFPRKPA